MTSSLRRLGLMLVSLAALLTIAAGLAVSATQTAWFRGWLRGYIARQATQRLNGVVSIEGLTGSLASGFDLQRVSVSMNRRTVISIDAIRVTYSLSQMLSHGIAIATVTVAQPAVTLLRDEGGWELGRLVKAGVAGGSPWPVSINRLVIANGSCAISGLQSEVRLNSIDAVLSFRYEPDQMTFGIDRLAFKSVAPSFAVRQASGVVQLHGQEVHLGKLGVQTNETRLLVDGVIAQYQTTPVFALHVRGDPVSLPEIRQLIPAVGSTKVRPIVDATVSGPLNHLATQISVKSDAGEVNGEGLVVLRDAERSFTGRVALRRLDLAPFADDRALMTNILANVTLGVRSAPPWTIETLRATFVIAAPRISWRDYVAEQVNASGTLAGRVVSLKAQGTAFGAAVRTTGDLRLPAGTKGATGVDLAGVVNDLSLSRLPRSMGVPPVDTRISSSFHVLAAIPRNQKLQIDGMTTWQSSTVAGVMIADGSSVGFHVGANGPQYLIDATVSDLDLQRIGRAFHLAGLASERFRSDLNGHVMANLHGWSLDTMNLHATGSLVDSAMFSGRLSATTFEMSLTGDALHVKAAGNVEHVDPARVVDKPVVNGSVSGMVETDLTFAHVSNGVALDALDGVVMADLGESKIGQVALDRGLIAGSYHNAVVDVQEFEVSGSDVAMAANGRLAVDGTGQSHLSIHVDAHKLEQVGAWVREPLAGSAVVDAEIGGNRQEFVVSGSVTADSVTYQQYSALTATSKFEARVPNLDFSQTSLKGELQADCPQIASAELERLVATASYAGRQVSFEITGSQPARRASATGTLELLPAAQEVRLQRLAIDIRGQTWQMPRDHEAVLTHAQGEIGVKSLQLVHDGQVMAADGVVGLTPGIDNKITVTLSDVDVGGVDVSLLRSLRFTGTVNARAIIAGPIASPDVDVDFQVVRGKVFELPYESFGGHVTYGVRGVDVDLTLKESESRLLMARGHVPRAALGPGRSDDRFSFRVNSSEVDLGLVQGLIPSLSELKGFVRADVDLEGTADAPQVTGTVLLRDGAFRINGTGVPYSSLEGRIDLLPDRIHIDDLHVLDNKKQQLSAKGDLHLTRLQPGDVTLSLSARDFAVLDNEMGSLRLNSDLRVTGLLATPQIEGQVNVSGGTLNLDPILTRISNASYAATATTPTDSTGSAGQTSASRLSGWFLPQLSVHVVVPDRFTVKARDLTALGGPFGLGLGALSVTMSGDLNVSAGSGRPMTVVGAVNTVRGFFDFQSRRFTILRDGSIRFQGSPVDQIDPALNISAERAIQAVTVRVNLGGRLKQPNVQLTSTPPLDQSDILALIIFNQPVNQLGASVQASLAQRAGAIAAGAVTSQLTASIANSLRLDQLNVNVTPDPGVAAQLVVGQQVGPNLYVKVQQDIGDRTQTNVILEYELAKWVRLQSNYLQGSIPEQQLFQHVQSTGIDLVFSFAFK
jgi:autotransporter translocation and assembly factor TamB